MPRLLFVLFSLLILAAAGWSATGTITEDLLKEYREAVQSEPTLGLRLNAMTNNSIKDLSLDRSKFLTHNDRFNHELKSNGITNQRGSGRCWLFAGLNVLAPKVTADLKADTFELSQPYLTFYDKIEKANCFLEDVIKYRDSSLHTWTMQVVLESPIGDGGWWHYVTDLLEKYGAVPLDAMPETKQSISTGRFNNLASTLLRKHAAELRQMNADGKSEKNIRKRKEELLGEVYKMLVLAYGQPPQEFSFRYEFKPEDSSKTDSTNADTSADKDEQDKKDDDKPKVPDVIEQHTPHSFYAKYLSPHVKDYIAICNNPTMDYDELYEMEGGRNVHGAPEMQVLNLPIELLKHYAKQSLIDSQIVWFACDVGKQNLSDSGIFMEGIYDYETTFDLDFDLSKKDRIHYHDISPNHAMVLMGIDTTNAGVPHKWMVENSWGDKRGDDGKWTMYDEWFSEYILLVIIDQELLSDEDRAKLEQKPVIVPYWEPFFLALRRL